MLCSYLVEPAHKDRPSTYNETDLDSAVTVDISTNFSDSRVSHPAEEDNHYPPTYTQVCKPAQGGPKGPDYENSSFYESMDRSHSPAVLRRMYPQVRGFYYQFVEFY